MQLAAAGRFLLLTQVAQSSWAVGSTSAPPAPAASFASRSLARSARSASRLASRSSSFRTSPLTANTWITLRKLSRLRTSRYPVRSSPPSPKPLVNRVLISLKAGSRWVLSPSGKRRTQFSIESTLCSSLLSPHLVYAVPLV